MEVELRAGAKLDLLSPAENAEQTDRVIDQLERLLPGNVIELDHSATPMTSAAGVLGGGIGGVGEVLYKAPAGRIARVNRLSIAAAGFTPAAPMTTTSNPLAWVTFHRGGPQPSTQLLFLPLQGTVLPVVATEGDDSALRVENGETLTVIGAGLPADLQIAFALQVRLDPSYRSAQPSGR